MKKKFFQIGFLMLFCASGYAQQDIMMHALPNVFQRSYVNPAYDPGKGVHIGLPFMSSLSVHHQNTVFNPSRLFSTQEGQTVLDSEYFLSNIKDENYIGVDIASDIFSLGLSVKQHSFSLAIRERIFAQITLPGDLLRFPFTGNGDFEATGNSLDFSGLAVDLSRYTEYGLGWQMTTETGWKLGARAKYLLGKENIRTNRSNIRWTTDTETYAWSYQGDMEVQTSGVAYLLDSLDGNGILENGNFTQYLFSGQNSGVGLDLGIGKDITDRFSAYASVVDIGNLSWKKGNRNFNASGNEFSFVGIELTEAILGADSAFSDSLDSAIDGLLESLESTLETEENTASYNSPLRTRLHANFTYRVLQTAKMRGILGLVVQADLFNRIETPSFTLMYSHSFNEKLTLATSYGINDGDFSNVGLAVSFMSGPLVFYATVDNIMWAQMSNLRFGDRQEPTTYPSFSKNATLHLGMNIKLGKLDTPKVPRARTD
jgi:hypothetical protein